MIREKTIKSLEFEKILQKASVFASSQSAKARINSLRPFLTLAEIESALEETFEAGIILFEHSISPALNFDDVGTALERAEVFSMLTMGEILRIERVLRIARTLQGQITRVTDERIKRLKEIANTLYTDKKLEDEITRSILTETDMSDDASQELRAIRQRIRKISENIKIKLNHYVNAPTYSKFMQDNIVTVRNERYVVPLKAEYKGALPGLIHDQSASGATLYVEPFAIVELNNDLKTQIIAEEIEIERILRDFTARIGAEAGLIRYSFETITGLDVIFAKARFAESISAVRPYFNDAGTVNIQAGRHPLIDAKRVIPNSIRLGSDFKMLLITGPNTGGKTVCLKLIGLLEIMGMSGLFVPALHAELAVFNEIFCDIGDEQSIEQNLSTFSSHMTNAVSIIENLTENSLVLFDELGAGTDPAEGASLALSIAEYVLRVGAKSVITTHYNEFKEFALMTDGAQNASMDFDPNTYSPTYKLIIGAPGASNALLIAEKLGLKKEIVERAKMGVSAEKQSFDAVLLSLEKARKDADFHLNEALNARKIAEAEQKRTEEMREKLFEQREKLNQTVKRETKKLVEEALFEANEIIETMRTMLDNPQESDLFEAQRLRKSLKKYVISEENEFLEIIEESGGIQEGDRVFIASLNSEGDVLKINPIKNEAKVQIGKITSNIEISNLKRIKRQVKNDKKPLMPTKMELFIESIPHEINLIGKASDEAIFALDEYLDKCIRGKLSEARIIHGHGEGILKKAVQAHLRSKKIAFREGLYNEGGKGVTIAIFK